MAISAQQLTIYLYSARCAVIFAIAQLSCFLSLSSVLYLLWTVSYSWLFLSNYKWQLFSTIAETT